MKPYYESNGVRIYHGSAFELAGPLSEGAGMICTDPPYSEKTHTNARSQKAPTTKGALVTFAPVTVEDIRTVFAAIRSGRWIVATIDYRHVVALEALPPEGVKFIRFGVWTKPDGSPQFTGDRPATGWEAVAILHREGNGRLRWNGGGKPATWHHPIVKNASIYPTQKPLPLFRDFIRLFAEKGELIFDPFCGSGTTLLAAADHGHPAVGCDIDEAACEIAAKRLDAYHRQGGLFAGRLLNVE